MVNLNMSLKNCRYYMQLCCNIMIILEYVFSKRTLKYDWWNIKRTFEYVCSHVYMY